MAPAKGFTRKVSRCHSSSQRPKKGGVARYIGRGLNVWSNVFIDDMVDLFVLALEKATAGSFFFAESGEASMKINCRANQSSDGIRGSHAELAARRGRSGMGKRNGPVWPRLQLSRPRDKGSADSGLATLGAVLGKLSQDHLVVASLKGNFSRLRTKEDPDRLMAGLMLLSVLSQISFFSARAALSAIRCAAKLEASL
jgi:hypothetical protein